MTGSRPTSVLAGPSGPLEYLTLGSGLPSTVFAHGLAGSIESTRPFGSGVTGRRTFFHFRGHGRSATPEGDWTYAALARELGAVADEVAATRCLGISLGAGALCALLAGDPQRFERLVFVVPASLDARGERARTPSVDDRFSALAEALDSRDEVAAAEHLLSVQPRATHDDPDVRSWVRSRARALLGTDVTRALRSFPGSVPLADRAVLNRVTAPALVIAEEGDDVHPVEVARQLADALGDAGLEVLPPGGLLWTHRRRVRELVSEFLSFDT